MRPINARIIVVGAVLLVVAALFFFGMLTIAPKSNDPATMMRTVGQVFGAVAGLAVVMIIFGQNKKK